MREVDRQVPLTASLAILTATDSSLPTLQGRENLVAEGMGLS